MGKEAVEYRGCDNLVWAPVTEDTAAGYAAGTVIDLAPAGTIAKAIAQSSATKYYDNKPMIIIQAKGADTVTLTIPSLDHETLAAVTGQYVDPDTGMLSEGPANPPYGALGYRLKMTDGEYMYVWRHKGTFNTPDETSATENDGTDTNNQSLVYTGINTVHKFSKSGNSASAVVVKRAEDDPDVVDFFEAVQTIDTFGV
jgi:phi13 family phage major tail protein